MHKTHIWFYAMDAARSCVRRDGIRYRVYGYPSPWGGWAYTLQSADRPIDPRPINRCLS